MSIVVDGRALAQKELERISAEINVLDSAPRLVVFTINPSFETQSFLRIKKEKSEEVGVELTVVELSESVTTEGVIEKISETGKTCEGIILQLPFTQSLDVEQILSVLPRSHDVDVIGGGATEQLEADESVLPPVVGAIKLIADEHGIALKDKKAVVIGKGRLVGAPASKWLQKQGCDVTVVTKETQNIAESTENADIIVSGAGVPGLITPEIIKEGVVLFDAGTSEDAGRLVGDADPACKEKASLFTPVPGGIGPITIAMLLRNLILLSKAHRS